MTYELYKTPKQAYRDGFETGHSWDQGHRPGGPEGKHQTEWLRGFDAGLEKQMQRKRLPTEWMTYVFSKARNEDA